MGGDVLTVKRWRLRCESGRHKSHRISLRLLEGKNLHFIDRFDGILKYIYIYVYILNASNWFSSRFNKSTLKPFWFCSAPEVFLETLESRLPKSPIIPYRLFPLYLLELSILKSLIQISCINKEESILYLFKSS